MAVRDTDLIADASFGICVIDFENGALLRNQACRDFCHCPYEKGCPLVEGRSGCRLANLTADSSHGDVHVLRAQELDGRFFDLVYFCEGRREYRFVFPRDMRLEALGREFKDYGLTQRELEITALALVGLSNDRIGEKLGIARNTLRTHLKSIYRKLPRNARLLLGSRA